MAETNFEFSNDYARIERDDLHVYQSFLEKDDAERVRVARWVHAQSYRGEGFVHDGAITESGELHEDLDKARGDRVKYYIGYDKSGRAVSTLRVVDAADVGGFTGLPAYLHCKDKMPEETLEALVKMELEGRPIKEISAFGHVPDAHPAAGIELLRHVLQDELGTDAVWFFTMVTPRYKALVHRFGSKAMRQVGDPIELNDERVRNVMLTPAIVDTTSFFDDVKDGILDESNELRRHRMVESLRSFVMGVDPSRLSDDVKLLLAQDEDFTITAYSQHRGVYEQHDRWTPPIGLDLSSRFDKVYARKLVDSGRVQQVLDPRWLEHEGDGQLPEKEGTWFYYPWRRSLVHFPSQELFDDIRHARDRNLVTAEEQTALRDKTPLYAGLSVGSHVVEHMVIAGVGDAHVLADFDTLAGTNLNRIHTGAHQLGEQKVDIVAKMSSEANPYLLQTLLREGVTQESLESLPNKPSIIFDEVDNFATKALLRVYAKEHKIPLIMATDVGYNSIIDVERHDLEDVPPFGGRVSERNFEAMLNGYLTDGQRMKLMTRIIGLANASVRLLQSVSDPAIQGLPQLEVTASQGGSLATVVARDILLGRNVPSGRHVHKTRRAMGLPAEESRIEGLRVAGRFITKR